MIASADSSVVVASLVPDDPAHQACCRLFASSGLQIYLHALAETFSTLTGGRDKIRVDPAMPKT